MSRQSDVQQAHQLDDLTPHQPRADAHDGDVLLGQLNNDGAGRGERAIVNSRVVRKLDFILLPFLALLFLFNSLDRSNVGNAETADFTKDVGLQPEDLNTAIEIFFIFFLALQPVGAALGRKYGMSRWVIPCMAIWGVCTALHAFVRTKWQLYMLRAIIGALEAGFYPTAVTYLSLFYTKYEFARRLGMFYGQYCIAGAFGGTLSYFVFTRFPTSQSKSEGGWRSWQILFGLEGVATIILAAMGSFWLPRSAESAWFLNADERLWAEKRIRLDQQTSPADEHLELSSAEQLPTDREWTENSATEQEFDEAHRLLHSDPYTISTRHGAGLATGERGLLAIDVVEALFDWKLWYLLICNILSAVPVTAFSLFLPLVLKPLTSSPAYSNLLTAPPYLLGALILYAFSHWSDHSKQRIVPILWSLGLLIIGLAGVVALSSAVSTLRYLFLCILLGGTFVASPLTIAWFTSNVPEPGKRSIMLGINGWGNLAGILSSMIFRPSFAPDYTVPFFWTLVLVSMSFVGYAWFRHLLIAENRRRKMLVEEWTEVEVLAEVSRGQGPATGHGYSRALDEAIGLFGISSIQAARFQLSQTGRRGDNRMTFSYGL